MEVIMWTPQLSARVDLFRKVGGQVVAAIEAVPEVHDMAGPLQDAMARLQAAKEGRDQARAAATGKLKLRDQAEAALDKAVRQVYLDLLSAVGGDKSKAPFQTAFPGGLTPILDPVPTRRTPQVAGLEERLKSLEGQAQRAEAVAAARQAFQASLEAAMTAEGGEANARADLQTAKTAFIRELRIVYGRLTVHLGDARKVAAFFPAFPQKAGHARTGPGNPQSAAHPTPAEAQ
jgi:hypothetical protein